MRHLRPAPAAVAAAILLLASASTTSADNLAVDGDVLTVDAESAIDLGTVAPGDVVTRGLGFVLTCAGTNHLDPDATIGVRVSTAVAPIGGSISGTAGTFGPLSAWPADSAACSASPEMVVATLSTVTMQAPPALGTYTYRLTYSRTVSNQDLGAVSFTASTVTFTLQVGTNTPPTLHLPTSFTTEGNETGGAMVGYGAWASDVEDAPPPAPSCDKPSGGHFPIGTTTVTCSVTDSGGLTASGSFDVTVIDTTAPSLAGVPAAIETATSSKAGTAVRWDAPTASDIVDVQPVVACSPASGSVFPLGTSSVTCTVTDGGGNAASRTFPVTVHLTEATFDAPIGSLGVVVVNGSRSIPVKVRLTLDGSDVVSGSGGLVLRRCSGGEVVRSVDLVWSTDRWAGRLDTSGLASGCWRASVAVGSTTFGGFDVRIPAGTAASTLLKPGRTTSP